MALTSADAVFLTADVAAWPAVRGGLAAVLRGLDSVLRGLPAFGLDCGAGFAASSLAISSASTSSNMASRSSATAVDCGLPGWMMLMDDSVASHGNRPLG